MFYCKQKVKKQLADSADIQYTLHRASLSSAEETALALIGNAELYVDEIDAFCEFLTLVPQEWYKYLPKFIHQTLKRYGVHWSSEMYRLSKDKVFGRKFLSYFVKDLSCSWARLEDMLLSDDALEAKQ